MLLVYALKFTLLNKYKKANVSEKAKEKKNPKMTIDVLWLLLSTLHDILIAFKNKLIVHCFIKTKD